MNHIRVDFEEMSPSPQTTDTVSYGRLDIDAKLHARGGPLAPNLRDTDLIETIADRTF